MSMNMNKSDSPLLTALQSDLDYLRQQQHSKLRADLNTYRLHCIADVHELEQTYLAATTSEDTVRSIRQTIDAAVADIINHYLNDGSHHATHRSLHV